MSNIVPFNGAARSERSGRLFIPARLRDARKVLRLTQRDLGARVGVTGQAISAFERGDKSPDPQTFAALADALEQPLAYFTTANAPTFGETSIQFFRRFGPDTVRRNEACQVLGGWFVEVARYLDDYVNYPVVDIPDFGDDDLTPDKIDDIAEAVRRHWGLGLGPISNVLSLLESKGIIACRYEMSGESVEAFSYWNGSRPFIFMASEKEAGVRSRFDLAHELGHLVLHRSIDREQLEDKTSLRALERQADRFAGAFLLPRSSFPQEVYSPRLDAFVELKRRWRVSIQAMIYRCSDIGIFDEYQILNLRKQISFRKWRTKEPLDDPQSIPLERPRLLAKAVDLISSSGQMDIDQLLAKIPISFRFLEGLCELPPGSLKGRELALVEPTLK